MRAHSEARKEMMTKRRLSTGVGSASAAIQYTKGRFFSPSRRIANAINDALDPVKAPGKVRVLSDEEKKQYEKELRARRSG
jgi:hypothetical protein